MPPGPVLRMFLLAALSIVACVWALVRHYSAPLPALRPAPSASASTEEWGPGEIPVEEMPLETTD